MAKKLKNYEVLVRALDNFPLVNLDINVFNKKGENVFKKIKESTASGWPVPYLSFIEENKKQFTLKTDNNKKNWDGILEYSTDTENWSTWDGTEINSSSGGKLYLRGTGNSIITTDERGFVLTANRRIQCNGNIENLLDYETVEAGNHPVMATSCYDNMFEGCTSLTQAPEFPATTLTRFCYSGMFSGCTSLTTTPELPATTLGVGCYNGMFEGCTSLTQAQTLPATTLTAGCYNTMFYGCTSLTQAPNLPATTLAGNCYSGMFSGCTSLATAPQLPATTLAEKCYSGMFSGCTSLTGTIHCPTSTANNSNRLDKNAQIPAGTATVIYDL